MNSDFTSKDTSLWSSGIFIVLMASIKFAVDGSLCLDSGADLGEGAGGAQPPPSPSR